MCFIFSVLFSGFFVYISTVRIVCFSQPIPPVFNFAAFPDECNLISAINEMMLLISSSLILFVSFFAIYHVLLPT